MQKFILSYFHQKIFAAISSKVILILLEFGTTIAVSSVLLLLGKVTCPNSFELPQLLVGDFGEPFTWLILFCKD